LAQNVYIGFQVYNWLLSYYYLLTTRTVLYTVFTPTWYVLENNITRLAYLNLHFIRMGSFKGVCSKLFPLFMWCSYINWLAYKWYKCV